MIRSGGEENGRWGWGMEWGKKARFEGPLKGGMETECSVNFLKIYEGNPDEVSK